MVLFLGMKFIFPLPMLGSLAEALYTGLAKRRIRKTNLLTHFHAYVWEHLVICKLNPILTGAPSQTLPHPGPGHQSAVSLKANENMNYAV